MVTPFSTTVVVSTVRPLLVVVSTLTLLEPPEKPMSVLLNDDMSILPVKPPISKLQPPVHLLPESPAESYRGGLSLVALSKTRVP